MAERVAELREKRAKIKEGGGKQRIQKQHESGKLTARERIDKLVDGESFQEIGLFAKHRATLFGMADKDIPADGVVTGCATMDGRLVHLASQDFTVAGGAAGEVHCAKIVDMMKLSMKTGSPFIFVNDSGGARVQEGIDSLAGYASVFYNNVMLSGIVPQISIICGPCAGGAAYSPALTDFIIQTKRAQMFITGPQVIKQVTGETVTADALGGPAAQMNRSGVIHLIADDDDGALALARRLLSFLPSNNLEDPPRLPHSLDLEDDPALNDLVPTESKVAYDIRTVLKPFARSSGLLRNPARLCGECGDRFRAHPGAHRGNRRQSTLRTGGGAGHRRLQQDCPLHSILQCLQHPLADFCRCARIPAGC